MKKIFFSYSRKDEAFALRLAKDLQQAGADVWIDQLHIRPSEPWDEEIENALQNCQTLLVLLSPSSVISDNVLNEINFGLEEKKQVLPVVISAGVKKPFNIRRLQHIDMTTSYDEGLGKLLQAIGKNEQPVETIVATTIAGKWSSGELINPFDENDKFKFVLAFETMGNLLLGTLSRVSADQRYKTEKGFANGKLKDGIISFYTNEQAMLGSETVSYKDLFYGSVMLEEIKFVMQSERPWGFPTQKFTVKRDG